MSKAKHYIYRVKDDFGRDLYGVMEGLSKKDVQMSLSGTKYYFVSAVPIKKEKLFSKKVKFQTLIMFTHRLTSLIEAGVPILTGMDILWRQSEDQSIQIIVSYIKQQLEVGNRISSAMDSFPNAFPAVYRALIKVGELGGALVPVLRKLSAYLDYKSQMIIRTKKAVIYPLFVLSFACLVVFGMYMFIVPFFIKILTRLQGEIPFLTKLVWGVSNFMRSPFFLFLIVILMIMGIAYWKVLSKKENIAYAVDGFVIKIPFFGTLVMKIALSQFIRSLSILLGSGVAVLECMRIATTTTGNKKIEKSLEKVRFDLERGGSLYESFLKIPYFPVLLTEMMGIGESSGTIVQILEKLTNHFDQEVDYELSRFLTILEPMLIIFVGFIVGVTFVAIYLPIIGIVGQLAR